MPHFIFGEQLIKQNEKQFSAVGPDGQGGGPNFTDPIPANLCKFYDRLENFTLGTNGYVNYNFFFLLFFIIFNWYVMFCYLYVVF